MKLHRPFWLALPLLSAQALADAGTLELSAPEPPELCLEATDGSLWLTSEGYRLRHSDSGLVLYLESALGREDRGALAFRLQAVERGSTLLYDETDAGGPSPVRTLENGFALLRPGFEELYEARPLGLEQSFLFPEPLPGAGDLVVRLSLETELETSYGSASTLTFAASGSSMLAIQDVVGIDASGHRVRGELRLEGTQLELRLPDDFVSNAVYPLVLDPLLAPMHVFYASYAASMGDLAYGVDDDLACIVWRDLEKGLLVAHLQGTTLLDVRSVEAPASEYFYSNQLALAYVRSANVFLTALAIGEQAEDGEPKDERIAVLSLDPTSGAVLDTLAFDAPELEGLDIGGDPTETGKLACVVYGTTPPEGYPEDVYVRCAWIAVDSGGQLNLEGQASVSDNDELPGLHRHPRISQSNGRPGNWLCVWEYRLSPGASEFVLYRSIDSDGALGLAGAASEKGRAPSCDGDGEHFLIAYTTTERHVPEIACELVAPFRTTTRLLRKSFLDAFVTGLAEPQVSILLSPEQTLFNAYAVTWLDGGTDWPSGEVLAEPLLARLGSRWSQPPLYSLWCESLRSASRYAADFDPWHEADRFAFLTRLFPTSGAGVHLAYGVGTP